MSRKNLPISDAEFTEMYNGTHQAVARYCLRRLPQEDARDALTDTYLVAWRRRSDAPDGPDALPWLYAIARNVVRNRERSTRRTVRLVARMAREPRTVAPDPAVQVIRSERDSAFLSVVEGLPEADREVLRLRAFEDLDYDQIALVLGCSNAAARKRLSRALGRLAARLGDAADIPPRMEQEGGDRRAV